MRNRQQEKTLLTRNELKKAAKELFLENGYEYTTISEIVAKAGYSVGSYYRHWNSKTQIFMEIWDEYVSEFIKESILNAPKPMSKDTMIRYLLKRSELYTNNIMTRKLSLTSYALSVTYKYDSALQGFENYKMMLFQFLKEVSNSKDGVRLMSIANILHCILNADAMRETPIKLPKYEVDREVLYDCICALVGSCN